jgi:class 3 adenylate cyclase
VKGVTLPSGTVTFLLYDVERSTRAWQELPDAMPDALARLDLVTDEIARARHGARPLEQGEGDSAVLAFASATDAVRAADDLQSKLADLPFRVRAAVHSGDARAVDGRYIGLVLHRPRD